MGRQTVAALIMGTLSLLAVLAPAHGAEDGLNLTVSDFETPYAHATGGQPMTVTARITNTGTVTVDLADLDDVWHVGLRPYSDKFTLPLSDLRIKAQSGPGELILAPRESMAVSASFTTHPKSTSGYALLCLQLDPENVLEETKEIDNLACRSLRFVDGVLPNLHLAAFEVPGLKTNDDGTLTYKVELSNDGNAPARLSAGSHLWHLTLSNGPGEDDDVIVTAGALDLKDAELLPRQTVTLVQTVVVPETVEFGIYMMCLSLDPLEAVEELFEDDNEQCRPLSAVHQDQDFSL